MDSEHRHELEDNALAIWLADKIEAIKPHLTTIVAGVLAAVAAVVGWSAYKSTAAAGRADAWRSFALAVEGARPSLEGLRQAADENSGTVVEDWSLITWADGRLLSAANGYLADRDGALAAMQEAEDAYESLASSPLAEVRDRAAYGLARLYEMRGELDAAREQYARVGGPFAELASDRAAELASGRVADDYAWITQASTAAPPATDGASDAAEDAAGDFDDLLENFDAEPTAAPVDKTATDSDAAEPSESASDE